MIFLLDNYDSFTYNLYQYFGELGEDVIVKRQDNCTIKDIEKLNPNLIVISPGPCTPNEAPLSLAVIEHFMGNIPILGVCLGHQAIGQFFGGKIVRAKRPIHGKTVPIHHDQQGVFSNLVNPLQVTRYHSLIIERSSLPPDLLITAEAEDGEIMGVRHKTLPIEGIQFHPEAILTQSGHQLLQNALQNAKRNRCTYPADDHDEDTVFARVSSSCRHCLPTSNSAETYHTDENTVFTQINTSCSMQTNFIPSDKYKDRRINKSPSPWLTKPLSIAIPPCLLFQAFKEELWPFFLDSGENYPELGGYSFMGSSPFLEATAYPGLLELHWPNLSQKEQIPLQQSAGLDYLNLLADKYKVLNSPFPFSGGAVGFLSYDLKNEFESIPNYAEDDLHLPLWRFAWYDGLVVYDHKQEQYWLTACGIDENGICHDDLARVRIQSLEQIIDSSITILSKNTGDPEKENTIKPSVSHEQYLADLQHVIDYIFAGDIYQANLSQRFSMEWQGDAWDLYNRLHKHNSAPFAAFLPYSDFQILCSSPERFIRINPNGQIETRPIKGTRPRKKLPSEDQIQALELQNSPKDRAELTMIIDLERNDLGRICKFGTVQVRDLISLEKYPTVWHLVSTITGQLYQGLKPSDILQAVFPGGSITGAPKVRAMEIIEELEPFKRGIYTGSIGYIGFDGAWDLNIVIRTILLKDGKAFVNVGGGIVADSIPESEYLETLDKAQAQFRVLNGGINDSQ